MDVTLSGRHGFYVTAVRRAVFSATIALAGIGLLVLTRRLAGALRTDLPTAPLLAALALASVIVFAGRAIWRRCCTARELDVVLVWSGTAALVLLCIGCAPPRVDAFGWLLWLPVIATDFVSRRRLFARQTETPRYENPQFTVVLHPEPLIHERKLDLEGAVLQELTRVSDGAGIESVRGTLRADFAVGQRHATLYAGFCPPLAATPDVEFEAVDGPDAVVKLVQALPQGIELELRLPEPADESCSVTVEIVARPPSAAPPV
jgi:hypothetical protein